MVPRSYVLSWYSHQYHLIFYHIIAIKCMIPNQHTVCPRSIQPLSSIDWGISVDVKHHFNLASFHIFCNVDYVSPRESCRYVRWYTFAFWSKLAPATMHVDVAGIACSYVTLLVNTLRSGQNCRHFANRIFKCIYLNENVRISLKMSLKFVSRRPINNVPSLV